MLKSKVCLGFLILANIAAAGGWVIKTPPPSPIRADKNYDGVISAREFSKWREAEEERQRIRARFPNRAEFIITNKPSVKPPSSADNRCITNKKAR